MLCYVNSIVGIMRVYYIYNIMMNFASRGSLRLIFQKYNFSRTPSTIQACRCACKNTKILPSVVWSGLGLGVGSGVLLGLGVGMVLSPDSENKMVI